MKNGVIITRKDAQPDQCYVILRGTVKVCVEESKDRPEYIFDRLNRGSCFGVYGFLGGDFFSIMSFIAVGPCTLGVVTRETAFEMEKKFYEVHKALNQIRMEVLYNEENHFDFF